MTTKTADFTVSYERLQRTKLFRESVADGKELNKYLTLTESTLNASQIQSLFTSIEQAMSGANVNKTMLGKGADAVAKVGQKIAGLVGSLQDTTVVQGVDDTWRDIRSKLTASLEKSPQGSTVLRSIDKYQQLVKKYPQTSKFFWNAAAVVGGLASGGMAVPALLAATKGIDSLIQGKEFSNAVGDALKQGSKTAAVMGAKNLAVAGAEAASNAAHSVSNAAHNAVDSVTNTFNNVTGGGTTPTAPTGAETATTTTPTTPTGTETTPTTPPTGTETTPPTGGSTVTPTSYTTVAGDQLGKIAQANQTTTQAIIDANGPDLAGILKAAANGKDLPPGFEMLIPKGSAAAGTNPFAGNTHFKMNESALYEAAIAAIGFTYTKLPKAQIVDKEYTIRKWALNESLGRPAGKSVQMSRDGINALFYNLDKLHGTILEAAMAGPQGTLPGGAAPAGNTMPHLAADPTGQYATKHKGGVGGKVMDKVEGGLKQAGNWLSGKWKSATTKFEANRALARWKDDGAPSDSNEVAQWLTKQKVPAQIINAVYKALGFPAPALAPAEKTGMAAVGADAMAVPDNYQASGLHDTDDFSKLGPDGQPVAATGATGATSAAQGAASARQASQQIQQAAPDAAAGEKQKAKSVFRQIDDVFDDVFNMDNRLQGPVIAHIREKLDKFFPQASSGPSANFQPASAQGTGGAAEPAAAQPRTGTYNEARRTRKTSYIRETKSKKLAREFENFISTQE